LLVIGLHKSVTGSWIVHQIAIVTPTLGICIPV